MQPRYSKSSLMVLRQYLKPEKPEKLALMPRSLARKVASVTAGSAWRHLPLRYMRDGTASRVEGSRLRAWHGLYSDGRSSDILAEVGRRTTLSSSSDNQASQVLELDHARNPKFGVTMRGADIVTW